MFSLSHIIKELFAERTRVWLTILAIAWGTLSIALMLAIGEGLRVTFNSGMSGVGANVIFLSGGSTSTNFHGHAINQDVSLTKIDLAAIKNSLPNIGSISAEYDFNGKLDYQRNTYSTQLRAVEPAYGTMRNIILAQGRFINTVDNLQKHQVIVLGDQTAQRLFPNEINPLGKRILLNAQPFEVIGIMAPKIEFSSNSTSDSNQAWIPAKTYEALAGPTSIDNIVFVPNDVNQAELLKEEMTKIIALNHKLNPNDSDIVSFTDMAYIQEQTNDVFFGMEIFLGVVGALTLIVAGVGIANVMYVSVANATREIGIRMAIGARSYQVLAHYVIEALFVTALGGSIGFALTLLLVYFFDHIPMQGEFIQQLGRPHPIISFHVIIVVILCLGFIGFWSGFFPARKAANINPAEALRHE